MSTQGFMTLREFFLELLEGDNLAQYSDPDGRSGYISDRETRLERQLSPEHAELLQTGTLAAVEEAVGDEHNSPRPRAMLMVMPP